MGARMLTQEERKDEWGPLGVVEEPKEMTGSDSWCGDINQSGQ
jgi:hypothetical protein